MCLVIVCFLYDAVASPEDLKIIFMGENIRHLFPLVQLGSIVIQLNSILGLYWFKLVQF